MQSFPKVAPPCGLTPVTMSPSLGTPGGVDANVASSGYTNPGFAVDFGTRDRDGTRRGDSTQKNALRWWFERNELENLLGETGLAGLRLVIAGERSSVVSPFHHRQVRAFSLV